ncbi:diguanylate cyclase (GGDEF)-like protein [Sulfuritortus calidifontis]|uniref:diguanylate cyclase n=1 Tax=Sulfuritortus calidifontis TaxID=1914471 RepID=A0A4R3JU78_9PROT|nr:diguanylate cyclase [Sulfuritortus calidifontis]TCS71283.1 diguanylate cyclase (GGDEF)-like protein [Sulfuritortus calidifontis]
MKPLGIALRLLQFILFCWCASALAAPLSVLTLQKEAVGRQVDYLQETAGPLSLDQAMAAYRAGEFECDDSPVLNFGIGAKPVWVHLKLNNPTHAPVSRRLSIETAWLDRVEVYFGSTDGALDAHRVGDRRPFGQRPIDSRFFAFDHVYQPGTTDVFIRVETPDPMVLPIYLTDAETARVRESGQETSYGIIYGFLFALLAYNAVLYVSLHSRRFLFYSIYLAVFILMNVAYTGHGFAWLWPESTRWQQWSNPVLIYGYGIAGLLFAVTFLDTRRQFPRVYRAVVAYGLTFGLLLAVALLTGSRVMALLAVFSFIFLFAMVMLLLGAVAVRAGQRSARYFLLAAVAAMIGAGLSTLSVWGFIPYNNWTFRAVELGMLVDATLLALALAHQFRVGQEEKLRAEQLAQFDPLTGLNNRRAFYDKTAPAWSTALRKQRDVSVIVVDIDRFKQINDTHGHAHGDAVLVAVAKILRLTIRQGDVLARWGGEEFILFLSETNIDEALVLAERLRMAVASLTVRHGEGESRVTISLGAAQKETQHGTLDSLICCADRHLYQAKQRGRNQISSGAICPNPV